MKEFVVKSCEKLDFKKIIEIIWEVWPFKLYETEIKKNGLKNEIELSYSNYFDGDYISPGKRKLRLYCSQWIDNLLKFRIYQKDLEDFEYHLFENLKMKFKNYKIVENNVLEKFVTEITDLFNRNLYESCLIDVIESTDDKFILLTEDCKITVEKL